MKLNFNKIKIGLALCSIVLATSAVQAAQRTVTIGPSGTTNLMSLGQSGAGQISQFVVTSTTTNKALIYVYDSPTNTFTYTNASYSVVTPTVTNLITSYVNYYGATNFFTNAALIAVTNTVAANTNAYPIVFQGAAPTNSSAIYDGVYSFRNGAWVTNGVVGTVTVTITYEQ